jgi:hypothetical protein
VVVVVVVAAEAAVEEEEVAEEEEEVVEEEAEAVSTTNYLTIVPAADWQQYVLYKNMHVQVSLVTVSVIAPSF